MANRTTIYESVTFIYLKSKDKVPCEFSKINAEYQMHLRLRELATPSNQPIYPLIDINDDTLSKSHSYFSCYIKSKFISSYTIECNIDNC